MGVEAGAMDGDSPDTGTSNDNNDDNGKDDVSYYHLAGLSFWGPECLN
jgi:hypothetical protein